MDITGLLANARVKHYGEAVIYFVDKDTFYKIYELKENETQRLINEGFDKKSAEKAAFWHTAKIVNPGKFPVKVSSFYFNHCYSLLKDKEKIKNYIDKDFAIWVNKMRKLAKKAVKDLNSENEINKVLNMFEEQIKEGKNKYEYIKANIDKENFKIIRTDYEYVPKLDRPAVGVFYMQDGKKKHKRVYLRENVPNIIWEEDIFIPKKDIKKKIAKELKEMQKAFDKYYVKEK